jgi:threonine aldolase
LKPEVLKGLVGPRPSAEGPLAIAQLLRTHLGTLPRSGRGLAAAFAQAMEDMVALTDEQWIGQMADLLAEAERDEGA